MKFPISKLFSWLDEHILEFGVCLVLFFIPLWPKLPLLGVAHTWTYVRLEDILVALVVGIWLVQIARGKVSLKSPLTLPIFIYWLAGGISLVYCLLVIAPNLANFFPNVAIFHYLRRIEYMALFFVVFSTIKSLKQVKKYLLVMALALIGVILYGMGQKFLGFPAFLTMNEEFAKGAPLHLPTGARITSTFGGHYDLAAYLVVMIVLVASLALGVKKVVFKIALLLLALLSLVLLLFTASRVSFIVYLAAVSFMLLLQKKKILIIPTIVISFLLMSTAKGTTQRFYKTLRIQEVVYDTKTGQPIAMLERPEDIGKITTEEEEVAKEDLPLGTGFVALPVLKTDAAEATGAAVIKRPFGISPEEIATYSATTLKKLSKASEVAVVTGSFLIQKALVYDISFTTRFQGQWPRATKAFLRNPILGSGYSTVSLATDNDYLRLLGETGILGFSSFLLIFLIAVFWVKNTLIKVTDPFAKSVIIGISGGLFGMGLNAVLIDVFEASKVAFTIWPLVGILIAVCLLYQKRSPSWSKEIKGFVFSPLFTLLALGGLSFLFFRPIFSCYFVGDDFTWLRMGAEGSVSQFISYLTLAKGFFYRPLGKMLFFISYALFWLKPVGYHLTSLAVHFATGLAVYFWVKLVLKDKLGAFLASLFFVFHPIHSESVIWASGVMVLLAGFFGLWTLVFYEKYQREGDRRYFFAALPLFFLALLSHELAIILPLLIVWSDFCFRRKKFFQKTGLLKLVPFLEVFLFYLCIRWLAGTHWFSGDYSFNLKRLPFNFLGNFLGYLGEFVFGKRFIPFYEMMRSFWRTRIFVFCGFFGFFAALCLLVFWFLKKTRVYKKIFDQNIIFGLGFIFFALFSVLGLGNIAERYTYIALIGFAFLASCFIMKLRDFFLKKNYYLTPIVIFLTAGPLLLFYRNDFKKFETEWKQAGEITFNTLTLLRQNYPFFPKKSTLFFVNVPIRIGRAWVFPVGLEDALWFVYRDQTLGVRKESDRKAALLSARNIPNSFVFEFEGDRLKELKME